MLREKQLKSFGRRPRRILRSLLFVCLVLYVSLQYINHRRASKKRPHARQHAGGGGAHRFIFSTFLRQHGLEHGAGPTDPDASRRRMQAAWAEFHRVKANRHEWAKAQSSGRRATRSNALGSRSFGVSLCAVGQKRKRMEPAWQRSVRVCFGPVASPPSLESGHSDRALAVQSSASLPWCWHLCIYIMLLLVHCSTGRLTETSENVNMRLRCELGR